MVNQLVCNDEQAKEKEKAKIQDQVQVRSNIAIIFCMPLRHQSTPAPRTQRVYPESSGIEKPNLLTPSVRVILIPSRHPVPVREALNSCLKPLSKQNPTLTAASMPALLLHSCCIHCIHALAWLLLRLLRTHSCMASQKHSPARMTPPLSLKPLCKLRSAQLCTQLTPCVPKDQHNITFQESQADKGSIQPHALTQTII